MLETPAKEPTAEPWLTPGTHTGHRGAVGLGGVILVLLSGYSFDTAGLLESWPMWRLFIYLTANMHAVIVLPGEFRNLLHK